jgi:tRNA(fMet)-specific endonuclease VapC
MGRRLILDTNVLIAYERGTIDRATLDDDELAIASVTVAEYRVGIELADTPERAAQRSRALATIMSVIDVMDYTPAPRRIMIACLLTCASLARRDQHTT